MRQKIAGLFSAVVLAAVTLWFYTGAMAAPNAINLSLKFSTEAVYIGNPKFKANIEVERTNETGAPPFELRFLLPQGSSIDGGEEEILMEGDESGKLSFENGALIVSGLELSKGNFKMQVPLKFEGCPGNENSCELTGKLDLRDSKEEEGNTSATIEAIDLKPVLADDLVVNITSPGDIPLNSFLIEMIYTRSPGTASEDMILSYQGIPWENISDFKTVVEGAEGFEPEPGAKEDGFQAKGKIAEGGQVILSFNLGMPPCANGATECSYSHKAIAGDSYGNVVVWEKEFNYVEPANDVGDLSLELNLIGAGIGLAKADLTLQRDGGEGGQEGQLKIEFPDGLKPSPDSFKVQKLNADVGDPSQEGQFLIWPVLMQPDSTVQILLEASYDPEVCEDPECKFILNGFYEAGDLNNVIMKSAELAYSNPVDPPAGGEPKLSLEIISDTPVLKPGDEVELSIVLEAAAARRMAGEYGFLLEVSGLNPTGKVQAEFVEATPEKLVYIEHVPSGLKWEGEMGGGGKISLRTQYKADHCANGASCSADVVARFLLPSGEELTAKESVLIEDDSGFDPDLVEYKAAILAEGSDKPESFDDLDSLPFEGACMTDCERILIGIKNGNEDTAESHITITFPDYVRIKPAAGTKMMVSEDKEAKTRTATILTLIKGGSSDILGLEAQIDGVWDLLDVLDDDSRIPIEISACSQAVGSKTCLKDSKESEGRAPDNILLLYLIWRMRDFGDAPTQYNHFGVAMNAYGPGTATANYPLARDSSILPAPPFQIKGPAHRLSNLFHLGESVSPEFAIDRNWDADGVNNIEPSISADDNNNDLYDDGVDLSAISLPDPNGCNANVDIPVEVTITPLIIAFFEQRDADGLAHINIWLDSDRDGSWGNGPGICAPASNDHEHIVIDHTFDPVALGVGTHVVTTTSPLIAWPQAFGLPDEPAWMRVMLTAVESNKDFQPGAAIPYGDGRGEDFVYFAGETEDYLFVESSALAGGSSSFTADMTLDVELINPGTDAKEEELEFPGVNDADGEVVIRFRNDGYKTAEDIEILVDLGDSQSQLKYGKFTRLNCKGCDTNIILDQGKFTIDFMDPDEFGEIILGWHGCLTCVRTIEDTQATATFSIKSKQDFRLENNTRFFENWPPSRRLAPQITLGWHGCLTCVRSIEDGQLIPDAYNFLFETNNPNVSHYRMYKDGEQVGADQEMCDGIPCEDLGFDDLGFVIANGGGLGITTFTYVDKQGKESPHSKPIELSCTNDIVRGSLIFIDEESGKQFRVSAEKYTDDIITALQGVYPSRSYKAVVMYCGDDPTPQLSLKIGDKDIIFTPLKEGDVIYETSFLLEVSGKRAPSSIVMSVVSNGTTYEDGFTSDEPASGMVKDSSTGAAISNAQILILTEQTAEFGGETVSVMAPWSGGATGQSNPVSVSSDGSYTIEVPNGTYQIVAIADGYQSYRSSIMDVVNGQIASTINLIEARPAPSNINIGVGESGFEQSFMQVEKGWVVKFINTGSGLHGAASDEIGESSGLMAPGESFKMAFESEGTFTIVDPANPGNSLIVEVVSSPSEPGGDSTTIFLPIILR